MTKEKQKTTNNQYSVKVLQNGLHSDFDPLFQPDGSYRFALNMINSHNQGTAKKNEEGTIEIDFTRDMFIPLGKVYVNDNNIVIFLVSEDEEVSMIGLFKENNTFEVLVETPLLNFKISNQIEATFRLRRGCERVIYFTDNLNIPRQFNLDGAEDYKTDGIFDPEKFELIRTPRSIPTFKKIDVSDSGGNLEAGSYTVHIKYVDENFNETSWLENTDTINIYNTLSAEDFRDIAGNHNTYPSLDKEGEINPLAFLNSTKCISIEIDNLDESFPYYKLGFTVATSGTGFVNKVVETPVISFENKNFVLTSIYNLNTIQEEDMIFDDVFISSCKTLEQIENNLLLGNTKGWQGNLCNLQKYASRISSDCKILKEDDLLDTNNKGNMKHPCLNIADISNNFGAGYMPEEIYSFGIVYIFKSGFKSPVYHIPGRNETYNKTESFLQGPDIYPMAVSIYNNSNDIQKNSCASSKYIEPANCSNTSYWGIDNIGEPLSNTNIRHHMFPSRSFYDKKGNTLIKPFIDIEEESGGKYSKKYFSVNMSFNPKDINEEYDPKEIEVFDACYKEEDYPSWLPHNIDITFYAILYDENGYIVNNDLELKSSYGKFPSWLTLKRDTDTDDYVEQIKEDALKKTTTILSEVYEVPEGYELQLKSGIVGEIKYITYEKDSVTFKWNKEDKIDYLIVEESAITGSTSNGISFSGSKEPKISKEIRIERDYSSTKYGIIFSNIDCPTKEDIGIDDDCIGYYIVRNERQEDFSCVYDTAIFTPMGKAVSEKKVIGFDDYISPTSLSPENMEGGKISFDKRFYNVINTKHKYLNKEILAGAYTFKYEGFFYKTNIVKSSLRVNDVLDGSSLDNSKEKATDVLNFDYGLNEEEEDWGTKAVDPHFRGRTGWCFKMLCRDTALDYDMSTDLSGKTILVSNQSKFHYLLGGEYTETKMSKNQCLYNTQLDHKIQILELKEDFEEDFFYKDNEIVYPFFRIKKYVAEPYFNFRDLPYYKQHQNIIYFLDQNSDIKLCTSGDSYISCFRYNSIFKYQDKNYEVLPKARTIWQYIVAAVLLAISIAASVFTAGSSLALAAVILIAIAGTCFSIASHIDTNTVLYNLDKVRNDGIQTTIEDAFTRREYYDRYYLEGTGNFLDGEEQTPENTCAQNGASDDEIQYLSDTLTDFWFESYININLKVKTKGEGFLRSPGIITSGIGLGEKIDTVKNSGGAIKDTKTWLITRTGDEKYNGPFLVGCHKMPSNEVEIFSFAKCLTTDLKRLQGKVFMGMPLGEMYLLNLDYDRRGKQKPFFHIPLTYDCCSDCSETFPHRFYWSEQSFTEQATDNFRNFKFNNYKDIEGETGSITKLFSLQDQLFIHTEEGLWQVPKNQQQVVQDEIVSFIGTGNLFDIPPKKIVEDSTGLSAGCIDKESILNTSYGYFFVCSKQNAIYHFDGQKLTAISEIGMDKFFSDNTLSLVDNEYLKLNNIHYPYRDNPSNKYGIGFISALDTKNERILFTRKDFKFQEGVIERDSSLLTIGNQLYKFTNREAYINYVESLELDKTIITVNNKNYKAIEKWSYNGLINNEDIFSRDMYEVDDKGDIIIPINIYKDIIRKPPIADFPVIYDNSWTLSYDLKENKWVSFHSYLPNFYFYFGSHLYSWINKKDLLNKVWEHNKPWVGCNYYGIQYPFMIELVSSNPLMITKIWDSFKIQFEAQNPTIGGDIEDGVDNPNIFFERLYAYNSKQCTDMLTIDVPDNDSQWYLTDRVENENKTISAVKKEKSWCINNFRDLVMDYTKSLFNSELVNIQDNYFIDKKLNREVFDIYDAQNNLIPKNWYELESLRDKYFVIRLIRDNFDKLRITINLLEEDFKISER